MSKQEKGTIIVGLIVVATAIIFITASICTLYLLTTSIF